MDYEIKRGNYDPMCKGKNREGFEGLEMKK